jgi:hypothetical protein
MKLCMLVGKYYCYGKNNLPPFSRGAFQPYRWTSLQNDDITTSRPQSLTLPLWRTPIIVCSTMFPQRIFFQRDRCHGLKLLTHFRTLWCDKKCDCLLVLQPIMMYRQSMFLKSLVHQQTTNHSLRFAASAKNLTLISTTKLMPSYWKIQYSLSYGKWSVHRLEIIFWGIRNALPAWKVRLDVSKGLVVG